MLYNTQWCVLSSVPPSPQALADSECYHEFCRLMMRLKSNYQLGELMRLDDYPRLIELIAKFTVSSLQVSIGQYVRVRSEGIPSLSVMAVLS